MRTDEKNLEYLRLLDAYGGLLTGRQKDVCELYYMYDLSLTEIAEQKGISKQSVSDTLAKSRALMDEYEAKLRHVALNREADLKYSEMLTRTLRALENMKAAHPDLASEIDRIISLMQIGEEPHPVH
ncbi:MAG TPA: hypothetical protein H9728_03845 [Candidatus Borkfalkia excrementavium]|uniref:UPF0122 protein H9728_03845 n=1 Tax=Candidatus Borkfalkia excrementavium TaxID=2838505 RepID=A0A9D1Z796_9FIRM|nr:hypothetical protein [Candidatus Borkfalkia excrementavium]